MCFEKYKPIFSINSFYLQKCVEEEHDVMQKRPKSPIQEPPLSKLREVCKTLESNAFSPVVQNPPTTQPKILRNTKQFSGTIKSTPLTQAILQSSPVKAKQVTPPSPNKVRLKPIHVETPASSRKKDTIIQSAPNSPFSGKPNLPNRPASHRILKCESENSDQERACPPECWIEPSWAKNMSSSVPGSPDSGVSSRPPTRDLATIQTMMQNLERQTCKPDSEHVADLGYITSSSGDFKSGQFLSQSLESLELDTKSQPGKKNDERPKIMPRPPAENGVGRRSRQAVSTSRFLRRTTKQPT